MLTTKKTANVAFKIITDFLRRDTLVDYRCFLDSIS